MEGWCYSSLSLVHLNTWLFFCSTLHIIYKARKLRKYKERRLNGYHGGPNMGENLANVLNSIEVDDAASSAGDDDEESFTDPDQAVVTKVKR